MTNIPIRQELHGFRLKPVLVRPTGALPDMGLVYALRQTTVSCMAYRALALYEDILETKNSRAAYDRMLEMTLNIGTPICFAEADDQFDGLREEDYKFAGEESGGG